MIRPNARISISTVRKMKINAARRTGVWAGSVMVYPMG